MQSDYEELNYILEKFMNQVVVPFDPTDEVYRSNMSKLWTDKELKFPEAKGLLAHHVNMPEDKNYSPETYKHWLVTSKDGKVIKSPSYSPANIIIK